MRAPTSTPPSWRAFASVLLLVGCGATPAEPHGIEEHGIEEHGTAAPSEAPGIDLAIDVRGRRIDVGADGVLRADGCAAARFDWERHALLDLDGDEVAAARPIADPSAARTITAPDGTPVATVLGAEVRASDAVLFRFEADGTLIDAAPGATPASTSVPVPERYRAPVLALVALVGLCWETHPRDLEEP